MSYVNCQHSRCCKTHRHFTVKEQGKYNILIVYSDPSGQTHIDWMAVPL